MLAWEFATCAESLDDLPYRAAREGYQYAIAAMICKKLHKQDGRFLPGRYNHSRLLLSPSFMSIKVWMSLRYCEIRTSSQYKGNG